MPYNLGFRRLNVDDVGRVLKSCHVFFKFLQLTMDADGRYHPAHGIWHLDV